MTIIPPTFPKTTIGGKLTAFWRGFVTPSGPALTLMLAVFAITAVAACLLVTPRTLIGPMGAYLPRSTKDTEAFATREALRLATAPTQDDAPRLYVVSDSILAHAFASDELTAAAMRSATSEPWEVAFLTTPLQGPFDEATLAESATKQRPGVVVLSLSFDRFGLKKDDLVAQYRMGRVGVRSDWADAAIASIGEEPVKRTGIYVIDNRNFLLRNASVAMARALVGKPAERRIDAYLMHPPLSESQLAGQREAILKHLRAPVPADDVGVELLAETVHRLKAAGNTVVFVENPVSDTLYETPADRALYDAYIDRSTALASELGVSYCRLAAGYQPTPAMFPDYIHVDDRAAQARLRDVLAQCVVAALDKKAR